MGISTQKMSFVDKFEIARLMTGNVPELDETYIETWIPAHIRNFIGNIDGVCVDEHGFWWGTAYIYPKKIVDEKTGIEIVVVIATKPMGQGYHEEIVVHSDGSISVIFT